MSSLEKRLEAVVARLEGLASKIEARGGGGGGGDDDDEKQVSPLVEGFKRFYGECVEPFVKANDDIAGCKKLGIGALVTQAFSTLGTVMEAVGTCKKPKNVQDLMPLVKGIVEAISATEKAAFKRGKSAMPNHTKGWQEILMATNFIFNATPLSFVKGQVETADFHLMRALKDARNKGGKDETKGKTWYRSAKALGKGFIGYVKEFHKMGLSWNPRGGDLKDFSPAGGGGGAAAAAAAPGGPPPMDIGPPPVIVAAPESATKKPAAGGMSAVFAQISKGKDFMSEEKGGATAVFKLKKITKEMKMAMKKKPGLKPKKKKKKSAAPKKAAKKVVRPPNLELKKGTWFCENQVANTTVEGVEVKQNVYIYNCGPNCVITVPGKVKAITVDNCKKCYIVCDQVVSTFELINCKGVKGVINKAAPSIAVDKSSGINIILNKESVNPPPLLVTSCVSEMNLTVPAEKEGDDPVEIPLPEQFETKYLGGKAIKTESISHGG